MYLYIYSIYIYIYKLINYLLKNRNDVLFLKAQHQPKKIKSFSTQKKNSIWCLFLEYSLTRKTLIIFCSIQKKNCNQYFIPGMQPFPLKYKYIFFDTGK